jgi:glycerophosphoryl diester phosphodiesterase
MQIIGERGVSGYEPENTLISFKRALEFGVDRVELDVYVLKTGEVVVIHDSKVDRTTNGSGYVEDFSLVDLRQLDAGKGEKIPLLVEVIELVDRKVPIDIELKGFGTAGPVAEIIKKYKEKGWLDSDFIVSSFNHVELANFMKLLPSVKTGALITGMLTDYAAFAEKLGVDYLIPKSEFLSQEYVDDAHKRGLKVFTFFDGVDDEAEIKRFKTLGIAGIFSKCPDKARSYLE